MNLPEKFTEQMRELLGSEYELYEKSLEEPRACGLRVNTSKISVSRFLELTPFTLTPIPWVENGFYYDSSEAVAKHPHYYAGLYYIQEPSAMIPASRLPVERGERVLDLCAAPGGKATELGAKLSGTGLLVANDISNSRAKGLLKNLELFGLGNILVTSETPKRLAQVCPEFFDKILIDAPCSGEGMFRKDASMIRSWMEQGPEYYAALQRDILQEAVKMLKPGGMILYSTCTFARKENEENIRYLTALRPDLHTVPMEWCEGFAEGDFKDCIRIFPHRVRGEGHFAALLQRETGEAAEQESRCHNERGGLLPGELVEFLDSLRDFPWKPEWVLIRENRAYLLPQEASVLRGLRFLRTGLYLGELKKKRFEPSQALAMYLRMEQAPGAVSLPSSDPRVLRYLKGETVELSGEEAKGRKGWVLFGTDGFSLGWGKMVDQALRNKYYPGWRIQ